VGVTGSLLDKQAALAATSPQGEPGQTHQKREAVRSNRSLAATPVVIWAKQAAEKPVWPVIPRSPASAGRLGISHCAENTRSEIPRGVYPEPTAQILLPPLRDQNDRRRAQDDSERARNDSLERFFRSL
jgi:hypothetical protein